jgi:O-antigen ligase
MVAVFIIFLWHDRPISDVFSPVSGIKWAVGSFFTISFFLCLPLPPVLISFISPVRFHKISTAWNLTGGHPAWESISYSPRNALSWWVFLFSLLLFYIVLKNLFKDRKTLKAVVFIMICIGLLESIYGLIQALSPSLGVLWVDYIESYMGTARGTFINRNNFSAFINMIWPMALGIALEMNGEVKSVKAILSSERLNRQALMALGVIGFLLALILTRSRAGITSGIVGFMTFLIISQTKKNVGVQTRILLGGIIILPCVYSIIIGIGPIIERFFAAVSEGDFRMLVWSDSLSIMKDHPLGIGLANYETVFSVYNQSFISDKTVTYAHNDYLQLLIETGWVGFGTLIGGFILFLVKNYRRIRKFDSRYDSMRFYFAVGAFSGLISIVCHSFFDFNLQIPANCLYFVTLLAILSSCTEHATNLERFPTNNNKRASYFYAGSISPV